jgi:hypothetical protein
MSNVIRKCVECKKDKKVELEKLWHGWFCTRCARTKVFRSKNGGSR